MARGHPDFGQGQAYASNYTVSDMGELAARLGAYSSWHRSGTQLFADGFEFGFAPWNIQLSGTGAAVVLDGTRTLSGRFSAKLTSGSTGSLNAQIWKELHPPALGRAGMETAFSFPVNSDSMQMALRFRTGTTLYDFFLAFDAALQALYYFSAASAWVKIADFRFYQTAFNAFYQAKIVVDLDTKKWNRLTLGHYTYDMEGIDAWSTADANPERIVAAIYSFGSAGQNRDVYVDNVVLTSNEP